MIMWKVIRSSLYYRWRLRALSPAWLRQTTFVHKRSDTVQGAAVAAGEPLQEWRHKQRRQNRREEGSKGVVSRRELRAGADAAAVSAMAKPEDILNVNVGILGHVDSGKTSLGNAGPHLSRYFLCRASVLFCGVCAVLARGVRRCERRRSLGFAGLMLTLAVV